MELYGKQLSSIVGYVDQLNEISAEKIADLSLSGTLIMPLRDDELRSSPSVSDDLLACSHQRVIGHQIGISNIME